MHEAATIVACATPRGRGGVAVVRVSGPAVPTIRAQLGLSEVPARFAKHSALCDAQGQVIDEGLMLFFPAPHSYTGEHVLEFQGHGNPLLVDAVMARFIELGCRMAEPGEFTQRAFLNDKMDLAQAEAIADVIAARTRQAAQSAMHALQGAFSQAIDALMAALIQSRVAVESALDFPDEDIDFLADQRVIDAVKQTLEALQGVLASTEKGRLLSEGIKIALVGPPNVGKSSLMNAWLGEERAIVTDQAGTTRDLLQASIQLDGIPIDLIDTAGLRETRDTIEAEGIRRAIRAADEADFIVLLLDAARHTADDWEPLWQDFFGALRPEHEAKRLVVFNKSDLKQHQDGMLAISVKQGEWTALLEAIGQRVHAEQHSESVWVARRRHVHALEEAQAHMQEGLVQFEMNQRGDLLAEALRLAHLSLSRITGAYRADDLLGEIFGQFCIGK